MTLFLTVIIALALGVICFFSAAQLRKYSPGGESSGAHLLVLCVWLVATVVWGRPFFEIAVPGLFDLTFERLLLGVLFALLLGGLYTGRVSFARCSGLELALFAFILLCLVSMILHGFRPALPEFPSPWNTFINGYLFPAVAFLFARSYIRQPRDLRIVFNVIFVLGAYLSITAFFEFFGIRALVFPRYISDPDIMIHVDRARGPFLNAAFNGAAIIFGFICGLHLLPEKKGLARVLHLALLSLAPPAIFFTQTRSVYLGFLIALSLFLLFYRTRFPKWKAFALPVAIVAAFIIVNVPRMASEDRRAGGVAQFEEIEIRMALFSRSLSIVSMAPLFGVGMGQFIPVSAGSFPDEASSYALQEELQHFHVLGLLAELGIAGALVYLMLIVLVFRLFYRLRRNLPDDGFISANMILTMTAVWVVYLTTNLFLEPSYCLFLNAVPFAFAGAADGMYASA
jgi:O-antigen ligase